MRVRKWEPYAHLVSVVLLWLAVWFYAERITYVAWWVWVLSYVMTVNSLGCCAYLFWCRWRQKGD